MLWIAVLEKTLESPLDCKEIKQVNLKVKQSWPTSWETYMQIRKQQLELDMEQQTGSKQEKEHVKAVYCHPSY